MCDLPPCTPCRGEFVEERGAAGADVIDDQQKQNEVHQENQQCKPSSRASVRGRFSRRATTDEYIKREAWPRCRRVRGGSRVCILYNCEAVEHSVKALMGALEKGIISGELPQNCGSSARRSTTLAVYNAADAHRRDTSRLRSGRREVFNLFEKLHSARFVTSGYFYITAPRR